MTTPNNYFHCWQNCKKCFEEQTKEKFIPGEKKLFYFFQDFERSYFLLLAKKILSLLSKLQSTYLCKVLRKNIFFWKWTWFQPASDFEMKKMGLLFKSFFRGSTNKDSRFQRKILLKKDFCFEKVFFFCYHFWSFSNFFVFLQSC